MTSRLLEREDLVRLVRLDCLQVSLISVVTLSGGLLMMGFYSATGTGCPLAAVGLACPGCGCGRAGKSLLNDGPVVALQNQPTATLVVLSLLCGVLAPLLPKIFHTVRNAGALLYGTITFSSINLIWQLLQ